MRNNVIMKKKSVSVLHIAGHFDVISLSGHSPVVQMNVTNVVGSYTSVTSICGLGKAACVA
jgi:hypothetical protein